MICPIRLLKHRTGGKGSAGVRPKHLCSATTSTKHSNNIIDIHAVDGLSLHPTLEFEVRN